MNCEVVQRRLLAQTSPQRLSGELRAHLAYCGSCRSWRRRLMRLEANVPLLPVPRSHGKARLIRKLVATPVIRAPEAPPASDPATLRSPSPFLAWLYVYTSPFSNAAAALSALLFLAALVRDEAV